MQNLAKGFAPPSEDGVLAVNSGSSTLKIAYFTLRPQLSELFSGKAEEFGTKNARVKVSLPDGAIETVELPFVDRSGGVAELLRQVSERVDSEHLVAVSHRLVHGGPWYASPTLVTAKLIDRLAGLSAYDPEHLPDELALIATLSERFPKAFQVVCFDTGFYEHLPRISKLLPLPKKYFDRGLRRYGFHGLSCESVISQLRSLDRSDFDARRLVVAHLGSGSSVTAVVGARPADTTMGFSPSSGIMMGTRSGDLDPGILTYLASSEGWGMARISRFVNYECGLLGVSGISSDVRELIDAESRDQQASDALNLYCHQVRKAIGASAGVLGGVDALVFTGGIGENCALVRARICSGLGFLGIEVDAKLNRSNAPVISTADGSTRVYVVRTNEERVLAEAAQRATADELKNTKLK